jgi:hypothetical protein
MFIIIKVPNQAIAYGLLINAIHDPMIYIQHVWPLQQGATSSSDNFCRPAPWGGTRAKPGGQLLCSRMICLLLQHSIAAGGADGGDAIA